MKFDFRGAWYRFCFYFTAIAFAHAMKNEAYLPALLQLFTAYIIIFKFDGDL